MNFGQPFVEIGWKMAIGQLLFLGLCIQIPRVFGCTVSEYSCTNYKFQGIWYFSNYSIIKHKSIIFILKWLIHTILIFAHFSIQTI